MKRHDLPGLLLASASRGSGGVAFGDGAAALSYEGLLARATGGAAALAAAGARPGEAVIVVCARPSDAVLGVWAAWFGGHVAVPLPATDGADGEESRRLAGALSALARAGLRCAAAIARPEATLPEGLARLDARAFGAAWATAPPARAPESLALVQLSSGSTRAPRGIALSHENLLTNVEQIRARAAFGEADVEVGWMPLFHDMGLIGCHLVALAAGARQVRLEPAQLLATPARWLDALSSHGATGSATTDGALRLLLRRLREVPAGRWDLSRLRLLFVGAEPIAASTLRALAERLAPAGLRAAALRPCYGLAEACVGVAFSGADEPPRIHALSREALAAGRAIPGGDLELVDCGPPLDEVEVRVVDRARAPVPEGRVGALEVRGPNVAERTVDGESIRLDGWVPTGDLAFLAGGRVVPCGRTKEVLFQLGRTLHAHDVEAVATGVDGIRSAIACAAGGPDGERAVLFVVPRTSWRGTLGAIDEAERRVQAQTGLSLDAVVPLSASEVPRTSSGKVRRAALGELFAEGAFSERVRELDEARRARGRQGHAEAPTGRALRDVVRAAFARVLRRPEGAIPEDVAWRELGGTSVGAVEVLATIEDALGLRLDTDVLATARTVRELAEAIGEAGAARALPRATPALAPDEPIAIVGLAVRLPGADDADAFWARLLAAESAIGPIPEGRWPEGATRALRCRAGGFLEDPWAFDAEAFAVAAAEAPWIDPQQRLLLELSREVLDRAGIARAAPIGVFFGASGVLHQDDVRGQAAPDPSALVGSLPSMLAGRVAHVLDLHGPALTIDTACSSALVAVHLAAGALRRGEAAVALVGGACVLGSPALHALMEAAGALSPRGRCEPFGREADGTVPGEGAVVLALEPLGRARAAGRSVLAILRGSAVATDGRSLSPMAPSPAGQRAVIAAAWRAAGLDPRSAGLVEAHGTGTPIGDPVELDALAELFDGAAGVALGATKGLVGHLMGAAGAVGLAAAVLAIARGVRPPAPAARDVHPRLRQRAGALTWLEVASPWPAGPRRAGVSAFGFGGTNAHVVLEEAPEQAREETAWPPLRLLRLSAPDAAHLSAYASACMGTTATGAAAARALAGRCEAAERAAGVVEAAGPAGAALSALPTGPLVGRASRRVRVALLFSGVGSAEAGLGRGLADWPAFAQGLSALGPDARAAVEYVLGQDAELSRASVAQPFLVAFQVALARALSACGLEITAVLGHSVGELAAMAFAGALDGGALVTRLVARGARLEAEGPPGGLAAVMAPAERVARALEGRALWLAADNGPSQAVIAGEPAALDAAVAELSADGYLVRRLAAAHAYHTPLLAALEASLRASEAPIERAPLRCRLASTVTGALADDAELAGRTLAEGLVTPVRFAGAFAALAALEVDAFVDVGPGATLAPLARALLGKDDGRPVLAMCRTAGAGDARTDVRALLEALGALWVRGASLDLGALDGQGPPAALATMPYLRRSARLPRPARKAAAIRVPGWTPLEESGELAAGTWLVAVEGGAGAELAGVLSAMGLVALPGAHAPAALAAQIARERPAGVLGVLDEGSAHATARRLRELVRALDEAGARAPLHWLVPDGLAANPGARAASAMAAALAAERPDLAGSVVAVGARPDSGLDTAGALAGIARGHGEPIAIRDGRPWAQRWHAWRGGVAWAPAPGEVHVVLGTGGVAQAIGRRLVERGGQVTLLGRAAEAPLGGVTYVQADIFSREPLEQSLAVVAEAHGPIAGVWHAAGTARVGSLAARTDEALEAVLARVDGLAALSAALDAHPAAAVTIISSVAAISAGLGRGLVDYAGVSAAALAVAERERARGRAWRAVACTLLGGSGLGRTAGAEALQVRALETAAALDAIDVLLAAAPGDAAVLHADDELPAPVRAAPAAAAAPAQRIEGDDTGVGEAALRVLLARALGREPADLDPDAPFASLGLESLVAVDLARELEQRSGSALPATLLFEADTLRKLASALASRAAATPSAAVQAATAPPATPPRELPLSPAQETFYASHAFVPELPAAIYLRVDLAGPLDGERLARAWALVASRHDALGATFARGERGPVQRPGTAPIPPVELVPGGDPAALERALLDERFDLGAGPLVRVVAIPGDAGSILLAVPHIVADAWSAQHLVEELLLTHEALAAGHAPALPAVPSLGAIVAADCDRAASPEAADDARALAGELEGASGALALPFDGDPSALPRGPVHLHQRAFDAWPTFEARARALAVSPFQLLLAGFARALARWSGERDVIVRVAQARRSLALPHVGRAVAPLADSLPVRLRDALAPLPDLAAAARAAATLAQAHDRTSSMALARLGGRGHVAPRGLSAAGLSFPSFQPPARIGALEVIAQRAAIGAAFTQLSVVAWPFGGRLELAFSFLEGLFARATIERLAGELCEILGEIAAGGEGLAEAPTPARREALPHGVVVPARFLARAGAVPDAPALVLPDRTLTYRELAARVTALAEVLAAAGARPGVRVGLLARPGLGGTVGALGVLASGAAYVPLDPDWPDARIAQIAEHAGLALVVCTADERARAPHARVITCDGELEGRPRQPPLPAGPDDLAYVMYTSGTTGSPKGVMVRHRAVSRFHDWVHEALEVRPSDRFIQTSPLSFGGSIRQIYSPLLAGATCVPAPRGLGRDPEALLELLVEQRITIWNSVPTLFQKLEEAVAALARRGRAPVLPDLRWILLGGEHVPAGPVRRWRARFGGRHRIANLYGSTETIVNATWFEVPAAVPEAWLAIPIGRARDGSEVHLLDGEDRVVPAGELGEIVVGGPSLADGYLHAPEETARAFPTLEGPGRVYRTGDLARADAAGDLWYAGRRDHQVQVRGNRVELGEIEDVLAAHPGVRSAAVVLDEEAGHARLVAFVAPRSGEPAPTPAALRAHVEMRLPAYMVPHRIELRDALPLTPAGKIDRRALVAGQPTPTPQEAGASAPGEGAGSTAARGGILEIVRGAFAGVLGHAVGPDDDFFASGGDSILALEVLARLEGQVPALPRPIVLYTARTPAQLAGEIARLTPTTSAGPTRPPRATDEETYPLLPAQAGFMLQARTPAWYAALPLEGPLDPDALADAVAEVTRRHAALRSVLRGEGSTLHARVLGTVAAPFVCEDLRALPEAVRAELVRAREQEMRARSLDPRLRPAWSLRVCRLTDTRALLLVALHHAMGDGVSLWRLGQELVARALDPDAPLPPLPTSLPALAHALAARPPDDDARRWLAERFAQPWPPLVAPATPPEAATSPPARLLDEAATAALRSRARETGRTPFELVTTAFLRAVAATTGEDDLVFGVATSGRDLPIAGIERVIGCLATALPVRVSLGLAAPEQHAQRVADAIAIARQHAPSGPGALLAAVPRHAGSPWPPGVSCFVSFLDLGALGPLDPSGRVALDLPTARLGFDAGATDTALLLGALCERTLRIQLGGTAPLAAREGLLDATLAELDALCTPRARHSPVRISPAWPPPLDAGLVAYLPSARLLAPLLGLPADAVASVVGRVLGPTPRLVEATSTRLGTSGVVLLPHPADVLARLPADQVAAHCAGAVRLLHAAGARAVTLAGLLGSWTRHGEGVAEALDRAGPGARPRLSTGHATTVATVVRTTEGLLAHTGRALGALHAGVVGFGSIGQAALGLLVSLRGPPRALTIVERPERVESAERALASLGLQGRVVDSITILGELDLLLGAASEGDLIDPARLRPGAMLVDDSMPALLDAARAFARMAGAADVVCVDGGAIALPGEAVVTPELAVPADVLARLLGRFGQAVPGCRAEAILLAADPALPEALGLVSARTARAHYDAMLHLHIPPAPLHLGGRAIPDGLLAALRRRGA